MRESTKQRVKEVQKIVLDNYESENQKKCYRAIWRKLVFPKYKICYVTMLRMIRIKPSELEADNKKLKT